MTMTLTALTLMMSAGNKLLPFPPTLVPSVEALVQPIARSNVVLQRKSFCLLNSPQEGEEGSILMTSTGSYSNITMEQSQISTTATTTTTTAPQFGDVIPLKRKASSSPAFLVDSNNSNGDLLTRSSNSAAASTATTAMIMNPADIKRRNFGVALASIALAVMNYLWQYLHPLQPIQLLYQMEQQSAPISVIGTTNKPTVVDFWAPWCENCKLLAPTLLQMEEEYGKDINFVMINGDDPAAWPLIEAFGVDAIPHLALVEADGTVDTALIGPVPKQWLEKDFQVLVENAKLLKSDMYQQEERERGEEAQGLLLRPLPYQMLDVFANRPNERRIQVQLQQEQNIASNTP